MGRLLTRCLARFGVDASRKGEDAAPRDPEDVRAEVEAVRRTVRALDEQHGFSSCFFL